MSKLSSKGQVESRIRLELGSFCRLSTNLQKTISPGKAIIHKPVTDLGGRYIGPQKIPYFWNIKSSSCKLPRKDDYNCCHHKICSEIVQKKWILQLQNMVWDLATCNVPSWKNIRMDKTPRQYPLRFLYLF